MRFDVKHRKKLSQSLKGNKNASGAKRSKEFKLRVSEVHKGKITSEKTREKMSMANRGKLSYMWRGGTTSITKRIQSSIKHKNWRQQVFIRDNFTCQKCGDNKGGNLNAHHIKTFKKLLIEVKKYLPLFDLYDGAMIYKPFWNIENGTTLCSKCHQKTHRRKRI